jgi:hypothetical protein
MRVLLLLIALLLTTSKLSLAQDSLKFKNESTAGFLFGINQLGPSFQHYTGLVLEKYKLEAGIVLGFDQYEYFNINPVGIALKTPLLKGKKIDTMLGFNTGLGFYLFQTKGPEDKYQPQLFTHPNLGFRFGKLRKVNFTVNVGYKMQKAKTIVIGGQNNGSWWPIAPSKTVSEYKLQRLVVSTGISF